MGQVMRVMKYDRAENERNAIPALTIANANQTTEENAAAAAQLALKWHRLDDGVMGGQSETLHSCLDNKALDFSGTINTSGGGFCSIRSPLAEGTLPANTKAIRIVIKGDGKTYKLLLSDGNRSRFGPSKQSPSWQCDIPTKANQEETITLPMSSFYPSFGPSPVSEEQRANLRLEPSSMREIGFMLSLLLSDGSSNPPGTFGSGIFPFSLHVSSIEPVVDGKVQTEE